ncbi:XdhC family protein [Paraburkholderia sp. ZP32-5]|uniref:XdhC family protein n=1 Tax=Paraburkholderia sp. ZP32-5 TaxID=2883245 RepID=UPI001F33077A|nr:XdhC family protein [Paraburkholderia sp. ZP32-5]
MDNAETTVLNRALEWSASGEAVTLVTVVATWGSSPRPPGSLLAIRDDGRFCGSVSGGCVEYDLVDTIRQRAGTMRLPEVVTYGLGREEARRNRIPCGGTLQLMVEPVRDAASLRAVCTAIAQRRRVVRTLDMTSGRATIRAARDDDRIMLTDAAFQMVHGPQWRVVLIGAGELSHYFALQARMLGYDVTVIEPRDDYADSWTLPDVPVITGMPDDVLSAQPIDARTAVVALTHDPVLDDLALWEALKSDAFYVGALGSAATSKRRRERLAEFDVSGEQIARLHAPIGLPINSRTPPEIAVSIAAQMTAIRNRVDHASQPARATAVPVQTPLASPACTLA